MAPPTYPSLEKIPRTDLRDSGWYTAEEVATHCLTTDCWVTILGIVYDLTELLPQHPPYLVEPILLRAGKDLSHWFDPRSKDVTLIHDPEMNMLRYFTPQGRFIHIPPKHPRTDWDATCEIPWWFDTQYMIGRLSQRTRYVVIKNILIAHAIIFEVPSEETINEILVRYLVMNEHARSYTWKAVLANQRGEFVNVDMDLTLDENGMKDESDEFSSMGLAPDMLLPCIHVYYDDDLTVV